MRIYFNITYTLKRKRILRSRSRAARRRRAEVDFPEVKALPVSPGISGKKLHFRGGWGGGWAGVRHRPSDRKGRVRDPEAGVGLTPALFPFQVKPEKETSIGTPRY